VLDHNLASLFTIATWMKHKQHPDQDKHVKEHIICSADDHSKYCYFFSCFVGIASKYSLLSLYTAEL
jgi:hypothetical protein